MKKIAMLLTATILALSVSLCSAHCPGGGYGNNCGRGIAYAANCKDGVCEFVPAGGSERTALAAQANPYNNAVPDIEGQWERDVKELGPHDTFVAASSDPQVGVVFSVNSPVKNFKVLSLQFKDFDANNKPNFLVKELYTKDVLRPERQLLVKFTFIGTIPNNGFSYTDSNGKTRYYFVSESGKDGSLLFIEF